MRSRAVLLFGLIITCFAAQAQNREKAFDMNDRLGRGINMGNAFEAPTETAWGNPWKPSYFKIISELGFSHVRVPVRWETQERSMQSSPFTIHQSFLNRIQEVVDSALKYKLHIIINMHHHDSLFKNPEEQKNRFLSQWYQIGDHFRNYSDSLLFEVLNEPHGNLTPLMWNEYFAAALTEIRKTNPTRMVLMGVAEYGGLGSLAELELPPDDHILLTIHYYNPFSFTHQGAEWVGGSDAWLGTEWLDTEADRESVASEFAYALQFAETNDIPIHIGEFGAYSKADMQSRQRWTTFLARWFEMNNMSWAYWEFSAGFGVYDPVAQQFATGLIDALLHDELPEATPVISKPVYTSDFSAGTDGWTLTGQGGASGNLNASGGELSVSVSSLGAEDWHLQLIRNNINLTEGSHYRISFTARAATDRSVTFYAGKASSPWNAYSGYNSVSITTHQTNYAFTFTMSSASDPSARLVFDVGQSMSDINISGVKVDQLSFGITSIGTEPGAVDAHVYPNPVSSWFAIADARRFHSADLTDFNGKLLATFRIAEDDEQFDVHHISPGMYILSLRGGGRCVRVKVIKK